MTVELGLDQLGAAPWLYQNTEVLERSDDPETGTARLRGAGRRQAAAAVPPMGASASTSRSPPPRRGSGRRKAGERRSSRRAPSPSPRSKAPPSRRARRLQGAAGAAERVSICRKRRTNFSLARRSAASGSSARCRREIGDREEDVAKLVLLAVAVLLRVSQLHLDLGDLLAHLVEHGAGIVPVEADLRRRVVGASPRASGRAGRAEHRRGGLLRSCPRPTLIPLRPRRTPAAPRAQPSRPP